MSNGTNGPHYGQNLMLQLEKPSSVLCCKSYVSHDRLGGGGQGIEKMNGKEGESMLVRLWKDPITNESSRALKKGNRQK